MRISTGVVFVALCSFAACGNDTPQDGWTVTEGPGDEVDYGDDDVIIIPGTGGDDSVIVGGSGDGCVELDNGDCVDPTDAKEEFCGDESAQADIIVDEDGEVVEVICYPPSEDGTPIDEVTRDGDGNAEIPQNDNGAVVVFDEETDGEPIEGDVTLTAERVSLFGNGVDNTIIDGTLTFSSNNSQVRGLTVTGDIIIDTVSNNASLVFCKAHGSLVVESNGVTVANCQVFGDVTVAGNGASLVNIGVQGAWDVNDSAYCAGCYSFADDDEDFVVIDGEVGDDLHCDEP